MSRIYMIGFMGSGKSTIGKKLAEALNFDFIDLDHSIEQRSGRTIRDIFKWHGEGAFREIESSALYALKDRQDIVISTGGGTPCFNDNMDWILESGAAIYLKLSPNQLLERLRNETIDRPLLAGKSASEILGFIEASLQQRSEFYDRSTITLDGLQDADFLVSDIKHLLSLNN